MFSIQVAVGAIVTEQGSGIISDVVLRNEVSNLHSLIGSVGMQLSTRANCESCVAVVSDTLAYFALNTKAAAGCQSFARPLKYYGTGMRLVEQASAKAIVAKADSVCWDRLQQLETTHSSMPEEISIDDRIMPFVKDSQPWEALGFALASFKHEGSADFAAAAESRIALLASKRDNLLSRLGSKAQETIAQAFQKKQGPSCFLKHACSHVPLVPKSSEAFNYPPTRLCSRTRTLCMYIYTYSADAIPLEILQLHN